MRQVLILLTTLAIAYLASPASAASTAPDEIGQPTRIEVYPPQVKLASKRSRVQLVVTGHYASGEVRDLTRVAVCQPTDANILKAAGAIVSGQHDGRTKIEVRVGDKTTSVSAVVSGMDEPDPIRFEAETLAVLTKQGCNAGSCHGAPEGKGGFPLSMAAYNPAIDRESIILGGLTRRVQVIEPAESLLLKKPLLRVTHVGGKKLRKTDVAYQILYHWIYEGARPDTAEAPRPTKIVVHPAAGRVLHFPHVRQQLSVLASFSDGSVRDVTEIATFDSTHKSVATVDAAGLVTGADRGQTAVTIRYLEHVQSVYFTVVRDMPGFVWNNPPETNYVDRLVDEKLRQLQFLPSATCDDSVFIRRVHLDLTGLLPTADDARAFLADRSPDKRAKKIDELLGSVEFARFWGLKTADLMRVTAEKLQPERAELFSEWLVDSYAKNQPFDQFARAILTASGDTHAVAPANYFEAVPGSQDLTETTAQIFMGSRINCAKCHNHPFENWTQNDYYRIGAVFSRVKVDGDMIKIADKGEMLNPTSGQVMQPWGTDVPAHGEVPADRRELFVHWLTKRGNPFFARVEVNRIWSNLLGRGIVHPVDDFRCSNPPSNVPLLDALAKDFEEHGYDRQHVIRTICNSQTYQRATETNRFNESDNTLFSHYQLRRLSAEQLNDAIGYATRTLAPAETIATDLAKSKADLDRRLAALPAELAAWETAAARRVAAAPCWAGQWHMVGLFEAKSAGEAHKAAFAPEQELDLKQTYADGKLAWKVQPDWQDGKTFRLPAGTGSYYLFRTIHSDRAESAKLSFNQNGAYKVWLNGQAVHNHGQKRRSQDRVTVSLREGENQLLLKVSHDGKDGAQIEFKIERWGGQPLEKLDLPPFLVESLAQPAAERTDEMRKAMTQYQLDLDPRVRGLRNAIDRLTWRMEYATQRPFPEQTEFLRAFGQPKRETACACERSSEPTVDQALQLLNGQRVFNQLNEAVKQYERTSANDTLLDELYLTALARRPSAKERDVASVYLAKVKDRGEAIRDLVWALVNTQEFLFQH